MATTIKRMTVVVFAALFLCVAGAGPAAAQPNGDQQLEGSWFATITATDPAGLDNIEMVLEVSRDGNSLSGTFVSQVRDPAANTVVFFQAIGTVSASRIRADR